PLLNDHTCLLFLVLLTNIPGVAAFMGDALLAVLPLLIFVLVCVFPCIFGCARVLAGDDHNNRVPAPRRNDDTPLRSVSVPSSRPSFSYPKQQRSQQLQQLQVPVVRLPTDNQAEVGGMNYGWNLEGGTEAQSLPPTAPLMETANEDASP
ncbi:hypothetical protein PFISCL1PPCAC_4661, partial [Pristionchus fissidentatus]